MVGVCRAGAAGEWLLAVCVLGLKWMWLVLSVNTVCRLIEIDFTDLTVRRQVMWRIEKLLHLALDELYYLHGRVDRS